MRCSNGSAARRCIEIPKESFDGHDDTQSFRAPYQGRCRKAAGLRHDCRRDSRPLRRDHGLCERKARIREMVVRRCQGERWTQRGQSARDAWQRRGGQARIHRVRRRGQAHRSVRQGDRRRRVEQGSRRRLHRFLCRREISEALARCRGSASHALHAATGGSEPGRQSLHSDCDLRGREGGRFDGAAEIQDVHKCRARCGARLARKGWLIPRDQGCSAET